MTLVTRQWEMSARIKLYMLLCTCSWLYMQLSVHVAECTCSSMYMYMHLSVHVQEMVKLCWYLIWSAWQYSKIFLPSVPGIHASHVTFGSVESLFVPRFEMPLKGSRRSSHHSDYRASPRPPRAPPVVEDGIVKYRELEIKQRSVPSARSSRVSFKNFN